jgi:hypothetical protein
MDILALIAAAYGFAMGWAWGFPPDWLRPTLGMILSRWTVTALLVCAALPVTRNRFWASKMEQEG